MAQQENKPIVVYFGAIWCQKFAKFQTDILGNPNTNKILKEDYILVAMDLDIDRDIARNYNVSYPPYVLLFDKNWTVLKRVDGDTDADTFLNMTTQVNNRIKAEWSIHADIHLIFSLIA